MAYRSFFTNACGKITAMKKDSLSSLENHPVQEHKYTTCYMCACRCGVRVTLEDGKIRFVQGNPNHPVNRGVLCGKGNAAIMKQCSPAKLRAPLLRKPGTARGGGEFVEISWDEALTMLSQRLAAIRADNPNKLAFFYRARSDAGIDRTVGDAVWHPSTGRRMAVFVPSIWPPPACSRMVTPFGNLASPTGNTLNILCCGAWPKIIRPIRLKSG